MIDLKLTHKRIYASRYHASSNLDQLAQSIERAVGSKVGMSPAYVCNLGSGQALTIWDDDNAGITAISNDGQEFYGESEILDAVRSSYGVEAATNSCNIPAAPQMGNDDTIFGTSAWNESSLYSLFVPGIDDSIRTQAASILYDAYREEGIVNAVPDHEDAVRMANCLYDDDERNLVLYALGEKDSYSPEVKSALSEDNIYYKLCADVRCPESVKEHACQIILDACKAYGIDYTPSRKELLDIVDAVNMDKGNKSVVFQAIGEGSADSYLMSSTDVNASTNKSDSIEDPEFLEIYSEVLNTLYREGYDPNSEDTAQYASAAAEYIQTVREETGEDYSVERWLRDTKMNYPEDLEALPVMCSREEIQGSAGMVYRLRHGYGPGTLPKDVDVLDLREDGRYDLVELDRELTPEELDYYDIELAGGSSRK